MADGEQDAHIARAHADVAEHVWRVRGDHRDTPLRHLFLTSNPLRQQYCWLIIHLQHMQCSTLEEYALAYLAGFVLSRRLACI